MKDNADTVSYIHVQASLTHCSLSQSLGQTPPPQDDAPPIANEPEDSASLSQDHEMIPTIKEERDGGGGGGGDEQDTDEGSDSDDDVKITIGSTAYRPGYGRLPSINTGGNTGPGGTV